MNKYIIISFVLLLELIIVIGYAFEHPPILRGSPEQFWNIALDFGSGDSIPYLHSSDIFMPDSNRYYYAIYSYHSNFYYEVSKDDMNKYYPQVIEKLKNFSPDVNVSPEFEKVHSTFLENIPIYSDDPEVLIKLIISGLSGNKVIDDHVFNYAKVMSAFYYYVIFDVVIIVVLSVWLIRPLFFRNSLFACLKRLGFIPVFMLLPYYLGYAPYSFRWDILDGSNFYGIYSRCIYLFHNIFPSICFDDWLLNHVSRLIYRILGVSTEVSLVERGKYAGLISALIFGFIVYILVNLAVSKCWRREKSKVSDRMAVD